MRRAQRNVFHENTYKDCHENTYKDWLHNDYDNQFIPYNFPFYIRSSIWSS